MTPNGSESTSWISNEPAGRLLREMDGNAEEATAGERMIRGCTRTRAIAADKRLESGKENERNGSTSFRYQDVVRCQHESHGLQQRYCPGCKTFYETLKRTGRKMKDKENGGLVKLPSFGVTEASNCHRFTTTIQWRLKARYSPPILLSSSNG
jgi:hypothetical protein